jgi:hypothetical protein
VASPGPRFGFGIVQQLALHSSGYLVNVIVQKRAEALEAIMGLADAMLGGDLWATIPHPARTLSGKAKKRVAAEVGEAKAAAAGMGGAWSRGPLEGDDNRSFKRAALAPESADNETAKPPAKSD